MTAAEDADKLVHVVLIGDEQGRASQAFSHDFTGTPVQSFHANHHRKHLMIAAECLHSFGEGIEVTMKDLGDPGTVPEEGEAASQDVEAFALHATPETMLVAATNCGATPVVPAVAEKVKFVGEIEKVGTEASTFRMRSLSAI